ncbi:transposase [Bacillus cereus]|uniref:transposase n=1 Tax=Bacillus cereus TaxID=1396 RepID=UPI0009AF9706
MHTEALKKVKNMLCNGRYTGKPFAQAIKENLGCSVGLLKRSELHEFVVLPKRWIVERTFAWLENYLRPWKNCERRLENSRQSRLLAGLTILLRKF